jgi:hypothetical protein
MALSAGCMSLVIMASCCVPPWARRSIAASPRFCVGRAAEPLWI